MRFGIRQEETEVDSQALAPNYTGINWVGGNEFSAIQGGGDFTELQGEYDYTLPNLDLRWDLTEDLVGRMSFSKTLSRPGYGDIQGGMGNQSRWFESMAVMGSRGNPGLLPYESTNHDFSLEYYYGNGSYISAGYFLKDVENFIGTSSVVEPLFSLPHPGQGALAQEAQAALGTGATTGDQLAWILLTGPILLQWTRQRVRFLA